MQKSKKIVVLGHFGVGKTSLIRRFVSNSFSDHYKVTIGVHITKKVVEINAEDSISFIIWDLEGTDDPHTIREAYLLGTDGFIFVFDVTRAPTFQNIHADLGFVREKTGEVPILVVGNKMDLVDAGQVTLMLTENGVPHDFLTSAKTGLTVDKLFISMAEHLNQNA